MAGALCPFDPADREAVLAHVLEILEGEGRIEAVIITGSLATGAADRWSDIDVVGIVADVEVAGLLADEWARRPYRLPRVAHHYRTAFGTTTVIGFLLDDGLEVDLALTPATDFTVWAPVRVAFDRTGRATRAAADIVPWTPEPDPADEAGFAWHDILHACAAVNRGRPWQAIYYLQRVRNRGLSLASERHGWDSEGFTSVDALPARERDGFLASLVGDLDAGVLLRAIAVATDAFLDELRRSDPGLADSLDGPLHVVLDASREALPGP